MMRKLLATALAVCLAVGTLASLPAIAGEAYSQSPVSQAAGNQSYPPQSGYDRMKNSSDNGYVNDYADKQSNQAKPQEKQSNQTGAAKKQYAQQKQYTQQKQGSPQKQYQQ